MVNVTDDNILRLVQCKGLNLIDDFLEQEEYLSVLDRFVKNGNIYQLADEVSKLVTHRDRIQLFWITRMVVPPQQQMEYSSLIPNYSAPSSVCTSDSGGGGSSNQGRLRTIRLHRRLGGQHGAPPTFGFSVRGGREHGTGFFVSAVEPGSEAHCQGLRIGDQIVRINGFSVVDAVHREVLQYIQGQNYLELRVRTVGMIPVKDKRTDPLTWRVVEDDRLHSPPDLCKPVCNGNNEDVIRDERLLLNVAPRTKLGCGICKGPEWKSGIFVQFTKENGLAREAGLRPGDQILQCNGVPFIDVPFSEAVNVLKSSRQLDLIIRKGAGLDLFPGESSGYNSSASSVNGDQSPNWGDTKRLSIVKEESIELEERLGQLDSSQSITDKHLNWKMTEAKQRRKDSPVLRVHFEDNGNDRDMDETNRDMSDSKPHNSLAKSPSSGSFVSVGSSSAGSSLSSAISQELQRRSKRRETEGFQEVEKKKDILKAIDGEKRQQHEQLMDEFKRVHRKMFAHTVVAENEDNTEPPQLKISHSIEERESMQVKRQQKDSKDEKVSHQRTLITTKECSLRDRQGTNEVVREVTILSKKGTDVPPPPPPMPTAAGGTWKPSSPALSQASSGKLSLNGRPPSCPTPDYDTSSSSSPTASLIIVNKNSTSSPRHNSPMYATVNKPGKPQSRPPPSHKNNDSVEMQSIESFILTNPQSPRPKPPDTYFVPVRNKKTQNGSDSDPSSWRDGRGNKQRPVSITIGEYPTGVERRVPTRFEFLPSQNTDSKKSGSETDGSNISCQLQSELAQTLSRSNLRKQTDIQEPHQNGISSAKGTVTISVNNQAPMQPLTNGTNRVQIENNANSRSKVSILPAGNKTHVPIIKPALRNTADKTAKPMGPSRVTIVVPNGVQAKE